MLHYPAEPALLSKPGSEASQALATLLAPGCSLGQKWYLSGKERTAGIICIMSCLSHWFLAYASQTNGLWLRERQEVPKESKPHHEYAEMCCLTCKWSLNFKTLWGISAGWRNFKTEGYTNYINQCSPGLVWHFPASTRTISWGGEMKSTEQCLYTHKKRLLGQLQFWVSVFT